MKGLLNSTEQWKSFEAMKEFWFKKPSLSQYVVKHWTDDDFFGSQFLNGFNPFVVQRCSKLPANFAVTEEMVKPFLPNGSSLTGELELGQQPSEENPIFLPSDSESDWLLAKMYVRSADAVYARGLESIPNFYYRDDALRLWNIINRFVKEIVPYYYPSDREVSADFELQGWVNEIFHYGFLGNVDSGIPTSFQTVEELIKFVTMVMFISSCQHAASNHGQFDHLGWIPNGLMMLNQAPPTTKGQSSMDTILANLPAKSPGGHAMAVTWLLASEFEDFVPLGTYPEQRFDEPAVLQMIEDFQAELSSVSVAITRRNSALELPYNYMNPRKIENSNCCGLTMAEYKLEVTTGDMTSSGTFDNIHVTLIGTGGRSERTELDNFGADFRTGMTSTYTVKTSSSLGKLLLVKVEKDPYLVLPEDEWYCSKIVATTPEGDVILFPCYRWICRGELVELRGGRAMKVFEDDHPLLTDHREKELTLKKSLYQAPPNFLVTEEMVKPFLEKGTSLQKEMEKGNIFLYNLKMMDGLPTRVCDGEPLHVTAGLCLFYMNQDNKLMPIAIQLEQQPSDLNPVFLPSDPETDWLLAKMFIKNADFMLHQSVYHLMNTHYLAEVFTVATFRNLPVIHPLYKLLFPHVRYTLQINTMAREHILDPTGFYSSLGYEGLTELMRRAYAETTYSSLCLPDNITARGLESVPNFYYRDDGLKLWNIINRFVKAIVEYYYPSDSEVQKDTELQEWISEIFTHGFLGNTASGCPADFLTVQEVIKFITMAIFTVSAQHAAVNSGQFDYHSWLPNGSLLLRKAPPTSKGQSNMQTILETIPNVGQTVSAAAMLWILSDKYTDVVPLGTFPDEQFDEPVPMQAIKNFQAELAQLSEVITTRNSRLAVPYTYLNPTQIENSVTI
ncbi:hypothetical protein INR49_029946 [Caranx melampygus]|nr:hypothetical protein INR49_029946 [Caranx melampygus]